MKKAIKELNLDFFKLFKIFASISAGIFIVGILVNVIFGVELDIIFKGGTVLECTYAIKTDDEIADQAADNESAGENEKSNNIIDVKTVKSALDREFGELDFEVELRRDFSDQDKTYLTLTSTEAINVDEIDAVNKFLVENFPNYNISNGTQNSYGATYAVSFFTKSLYVVLLAMIFVIVYVAIRFRKIGGVSAGVTAMLALIHDMIFAYLAFVFFRFPLDDNFIAVLLTILGFSLNDTIVIYDRIREEKEKAGGTKSIREIVHIASNKSFTRSLNISVATFLAITVVWVVAYIFGLSTVITFALPMSIGIVAGSYSSIFLAPPMWVHWVEYRERKEAAKPKANKRKKK